MSKKVIKLFDVIIDNNEKKSILSVLKSNFWASGAGGANVETFENEFKKYIKSDSCIAVNSGTAALNLALSLFEIKNKEVILPSLSFVSIAHCIKENGGIPIFVDVMKNSLCIDPEKIKKAISKNTIAILPVHFGGMPCDLNEIHKIAKSKHLHVIEDAAHATGAKYNGKKIGAHSDIVCFSFHPVKNLAMPNGGLISINHTKHKKFKKQLLSRRWCGITNRKESDYDVEEMGWNYYMNEFSAAIGLEQLKKLENLNKIRKKIAKKYNKEIQIEAKMPFDKNCSYHLYWILVNNREQLKEQMKNNGIETGTHYKPIHLMKMYKEGQELPVTESAGQKIVTIPIHPNLKEFEIQKIIKSVNKFV